MGLKIMNAINRARLRRRVAIERAVLAEMRENAKALLTLQEAKVRHAETALDRACEALPISADDIVREMDRATRRGLLA